MSDPMTRSSVVYGCILEWDYERGVLYIHGSDRTLVRICGLKKFNKLDISNGMLDITISDNCTMYISYPQET